MVLFIFSMISINHVYAATLQPMSDEQMSATTGQALMTLSYLAPNDAGNSNPVSSNLGFYKLGMEAEIDINANIKKLQLGCGGVNGAGACDIDIDYLGLSGVSDTNTGRANSSAKISNPFIEFAIKNPNSAATRGFWISLKRRFDTGFTYVWFGKYSCEKWD